MVRTTVALPDDLKEMAEQEARRRGITLAELIRESLESALTPIRTDDPLFADVAVFEGHSPRDLSARHDDYLYGDGA